MIGLSPFTLLYYSTTIIFVPIKNYISNPLFLSVKWSLYFTHNMWPVSFCLLDSLHSLWLCFSYLQLLACFYKCSLSLISVLYYSCSPVSNIILFHHPFFPPLLCQAEFCRHRIMDWLCNHFISQNTEELNVVIKRRSLHLCSKLCVVYHLWRHMFVRYWI